MFYSHVSSHLEEITAVSMHITRRLEVISRVYICIYMNFLNTDMMCADRRLSCIVNIMTVNNVPMQGSRA